MGVKLRAKDGDKVAPDTLGHSNKIKKFKQEEEN